MKKYLFTLALFAGTGFFSCTMNHNTAVAETCCAHSNEEGHICKNETAQAVASVIAASRYDEVNTSIVPQPGCVK